jgi:carbonic anhydrase/acetyltransferase-like protein (isoleucine patch superfamily)
MVVPARTLVAGVPAKVRRDGLAEELDHVRRGVRSYLELKGRYLAADDERELEDAADWARQS